MRVAVVEAVTDRENRKPCRAASGRVPVAGQGGGPARSSDEAPVMGAERRGRVVGSRSDDQPAHGRSQMVGTRSSGKSFDIPKMLIWDADRKVRENGGAAGVDRQSLADFCAEREGQPVQDLESDVVGDVLPAAGQGGGDLEGDRWSADAR